MGKSELRLLALRYANDNLDVMEYLQARSALIDDITAGRLEIQRAVVPASGAGPGCPEPGGALPTPRSGRIRSLPVVLGSAVTVVCVAVLFGYISYGSAPDATQQTTPTTASVVAVGAALEQADAEELLEDFLIAGAWDDVSLRTLRNRWANLSESTRAEARTSDLFANLRARTLDSVRAETALAAMGVTSEGKAEKLSEFGTALGLFASWAPSTNTPASPERERHARAPEPTGVPDWFEAQPADSYTVQLFSSLTRDAAINLASRFPRLEIKIQRSSSTPHLYRAVHGSFASNQLAERISDDLPADLLALTGPPFVRSFEHLLGTQITSEETSGRAANVTRSKDR